MIQGNNLINAYIYPISRSNKLVIYNPYIDNFIKSLSSRFLFLNKNDFSSVGILNILKYNKKIDYIFLHWIENIPDRKFGLLQTFFFIFYMLFLKKDKKVIWIMHNKISHFKKNLFFKRVLFKLVLKRSDFILTHASDGVNFAKDHSRINNIIYTPHPVVFHPNNSLIKKEYDILIWGSILPYKGIHDFLLHLKQKGDLMKYEIRVIGKCPDPNYFNELCVYRNEKIKIENRYVDNDELKELIAKSKCTLFPYNSESILSSGALMDTIGMGGWVIGPSKGAFKDLAGMGMIQTYTNYDHLSCLLDNVIDQENEREVPPESYTSLTWETFSDNIFSALNA